MADKPAAEVEVDAALVRRLLADQCPQIDGLGAVAELDLRLVSQGWDNAMLRLGGSAAVRVPRRLFGAQLLVNEQTWLAGMATAVDVQVPAPLFAGTPTSYYPWHWSVVPWIEGREAGAVDRARLGPIAAPLARFLTQLHAPAPADGPVNPVRGGPLADRDAVVRERIKAIAHARGDELHAVWAQALASPEWDGPALWLHGDLHPFNIVVGGSPAGDVELRAVVDFGDMSSGDPACDLATAWLTFDAAGRAVFRAEVEARCAVEESTWLRARGWALIMATAMAAHSDDDPTFARLGAQALDQVLSGD
ncbi:Predicted kinase, aminoglycoside phosphotransferase (APT) family [Sanguibacter gelidistatuariae]|uniref:Predicted kinase, aminoglycoside phosphotransferase (APT) family n=1 Tax=Sanguibacter gelidistatuariae TaxID=1814289 RepID=A0A1G6RL80_9MICO|nr:aminoglycoside phosphotransferase family protein [Sanguibacter gelidistatuariae]SDD04686.1 Predicted kinase, aminoglycoside phosphotransferase (APT) family [Sanguibacter gelidistatuariae]